MRKKLFITLVIVLFIFSTFPADVSALVVPQNQTTRCNAVFSDGITNLQSLIKVSGCVIVRTAGVVISLAFLFFLWGLAKFMLVAGDEEARSKGKRMMVWGIVALFVMVSIWGIIAILQSNLGIENITFSE